MSASRENPQPGQTQFAIEFQVKLSGPTFPACSFDHPAKPVVEIVWLELARKSNYDPRAAALQLKITLRQLERRCQHDLHRCPREFMHSERLNFAAHLLAKGEPIKCVAHQLGYIHLSNFSRDFKREFDCSPREYLARLNRPADSLP